MQLCKSQQNPFLPAKVAASCALSFSLAALSTLYSGNVFAQQLSGSIVDHRGEAIANALIKIDKSIPAVLTDENGKFIFPNLTAGAVELHVNAKNYSHINKHIVIKEDDVMGVVITLSPSVMEVIDVHATPLHSSSIESALPVNVISGDALKLKQAATLGETLKNEVGVHSSYYGPVASSPIIRGLDGPRVLISQNGLDAGDASRVGPDHVVAAETSTATQIEVLRGPATLFYGSGAIGGVVNIVDNRVPTSSDTEAEWLLQYNDVANEKQASVSVQTGSDNVAFHFDAFWRDAGDYQLPSDMPHDEHDDHEEDDGHEESPSHLANSSTVASGFTLGSSYLFDQGFIGFSYGRMDRDYGIPGHGHAHEDESVASTDVVHPPEEGTSAKMKQDRIQILSEFNLTDSFIKQLSAKLAFTDYQHYEIEDAMIGTTFTNKSSEARFDIYHANYAGWQGAWTLHYKGSDFKAIGDEAFSPPSKTDTLAVAWLEEKHFGEVLLQLGARVEHVSQSADDSLIGFDDNKQQVVFADESFTPVSASAGLVWDFSLAGQQGYNLGMSVAFSQRAPSAGELFSFGPHLGTKTFEVGALFEVNENADGSIGVAFIDKAPQLESSYSFDLTWRKFEGDFGFVISAFYNHVDNYYYQQDTGLTFQDEESHEGLPIMVYQQNDVDMYGAEAEFVYQISAPLKATVFSDYIRATLSDASAVSVNNSTNKNENLPRIPPMRLGALLNYQGNKYDGEVSVSHYFSQNDISQLETKTAAYTIVDVHLNYYLDSEFVNFSGNDLVLYFKGQNLTDEYAQVHSSFLKEVAPLPGRNFSLGIRGSF